MFNESVKSSFTLSFDSWTTDRPIVVTASDYQLSIVSSCVFNSPKILIQAHETQIRSGLAIEANNVAIFDNLNVRKVFCGHKGHNITS